MMMMVDVLIGWWEKERLAPPQLLARFATLIVKIISAELFVCKARQLLPTSDRTKGSPPFRKVPLTPPLLFEHLSYFAGGIF